MRVVIVGCCGLIWVMTVLSKRAGHGDEALLGAVFGSFLMLSAIAYRLWSRP